MNNTPNIDEELDKFLNGINTSNYPSKTDSWMGSIQGDHIYYLKVNFRILWNTLENSTLDIITTF